ncbi:MAG: hypothetical protein PVI55_11750 [Desulfobacterales bacterium]
MPTSSLQSDIAAQVLPGIWAKESEGPLLPFIRNSGCPNRLLTTMNAECLEALCFFSPLSAHGSICLPSFNNNSISMFLACLRASAAV